MAEENKKENLEFAVQRWWMAQEKDIREFAETTSINEMIHAVLNR